VGFFNDKTTTVQITWGQLLQQLEEPDELARPYPSWTFPEEKQ
jgi:hypothetical protein